MQVSTPYSTYDRPKVIFDLPQGIEATQRRLQKQYFDQSFARTPQTQMRKYQQVDSQYARAYGTPEPLKKSEQPSFQYVGLNILKPIPFTGTTAYQQHYKRHPYEAISLNPQLYRSPLPDYPRPRYIRFEGESTYKAAYRNSDIIDRMRTLNSEKINRREYWSQQHIPFNASSSYKNDFQPFQVQQNLEKPLGMQPSPIRFEGKTTYKTDFQNFKVELPRKCPVQSLPVPYKNLTNKSDMHIYFDAIQNKFE